MEPRYVIQLSALFVAIIVGAFISPKGVLKLAGGLIICGIVGLIIAATVHSESFVWIFGLSVMAVGFLTIPSIVTSAIVSMLRKSEGKDK
jgi:hypothetical protein